MIPVTAPIDGVDTSLLGQALASFGARPQSVAVITVPPSNTTALLWPEQQTFSPGFAEEQAQKLAGTLADRFPKVVVKTLPDGSTAELLTRDAGQFQPTALDVGATATLRAGDDMLAISSVLRGRASWVIVGNNLDLTRGVRKSFTAAASESCASFPRSARMTFHLSSGLLGAIDANGKHAVFCAIAP